MAPKIHAPIDGALDHFNARRARCRKYVRRGIALAAGKAKMFYPCIVRVAASHALTGVADRSMQAGSGFLCGE